MKAIKRAIDNKRCKVNGKVERFSTRILHPGDRIEIDLSELDDLKKLAPSSCTTLYEDEELIAVDKPANLVSENAALNALFPAYKGKLELIHRLDKETTGVLLLAKSAKMKNEMVDLFRQKMIEKRYLAIVDGRVEKREGKIESFLVKKHHYQGQTIWGSSKKGREIEKAITLWKCEKSTEQASLVSCMPITGRTHQLRVHLSEMGHPILGDFQYGKTFTCPVSPKRQMLHASYLAFIHPIHQKEIEIKAPLPQDFLQTAKKLALL